MRTAWLALLLLGSISAVAAMLTGNWRAPAAADATPDQTAALVEPVDDSPVKAPNWPDLAARQDMAARQEVVARQVVDPDPEPDLRGAQLPATPFPAAADTMANTNASANVNLANRHWHAASAGAKMPTASAQQIKRIRDSKAEMRAKRSKAAANTRTTSTCTPSTNNWTNLLRKLALMPPCTI
jgi:hypothetical protein